MFAAIRSMAEDMHAIAAEGQCRDNSPDIQRVLVSQLCMTITALDEKMGHIKDQLGDGHE
ncbi:MAG: hypothetical protein ABIT16_02455 [Croceibacterium sp.]